MAITGSDKALMFARSGIARSGATRSDYFNPIGKIQIAGVDRTSNVLKGSLTISLVLDNQVDTASLVLSGFKPTEGQEIKIGLGHLSNLIFAGTIHGVETFYAGPSSNLYYQINCVDYLWELNKSAVFACYDPFLGIPDSTRKTTKDFVQNLMSLYTTGFDYTTYVTAIAATGTKFQFTGKTASEALDEIAKDCGASWYIDVNKALHFFVGTEAGMVNPSTITGTDDKTANFVYERNISQIRTRVTALYLPAEISPGSVFDVPDTQIFLSGATLGSWPASGSFRIGQWIWTYTGITNISGDLWFLSGLVGPGAGINGWIGGGSPADNPSFGTGVKVFQYVTVNDAAAQTALAALTGTVGIVEYPMLLDGSVTTSTDATALAQAQLSSFKDVEASIRYDSRDKYAYPGRTVTLSMAAPWSISGTLKIQKITISDIETAAENFGTSITTMGSWPKRAVEALPVRTDFIDMLNRTVS